MPSFREISNQITDWKQVKTLDQDRSGQITASEVNEKVDTDKDGQLTDQELDAAGVKPGEAREQLKTKYAAAAEASRDVLDRVFGRPVTIKPKHDSSLMAVSEIDDKVTALQTQRLTQAAEGSTDLGALSGGVARAVINVGDADYDGQLSLDELKNLDVAEVVRLGKEMGVGDLSDKLDHLDDYVAWREERGDAGNSIQMGQIGPDYQTHWRARGDFASVEIEAARKKDTPQRDELGRIGLKTLDYMMREDSLTPAEQADYAQLQTRETQLQTQLQTQYDTRRQEVLALANNDPKVTALMDGLEGQGQLTEEAFLYMEKILKKHGADGLDAVSDTLSAFMKGTDGTLNEEDKAILAKDILHDIAYPEDIDQGPKGTCAATAVQMKVALLDPAKYAAICTTLASDKDYVLSTDAKGKPDKVLFHNQTYKGDAGDTRSLSCKIMQNAFMNFAQMTGDTTKGGPFENKETHYEKDGRQIYYDSRMSVDAAQGLGQGPATRRAVSDADATLQPLALTDAQLTNLGDGLDTTETAALEEAVLGRKIVSVAVGGKTNSEVVAEIDQNLADKKATTIDFQGHAVLVVDKTTDNPPMYIIDSWSMQFELSKTQLETVIKAARGEE